MQAKHDHYKPDPPTNTQQAEAYAHALAEQLWPFARRGYSHHGPGAVVIDLRIEGPGPDQDWTYYAPIALIAALTGEPIPPGVKKRLDTYQPDHAMFVLIVTTGQHWLIGLDREPKTGGTVQLEGPAPQTIAAFERAIELLGQHPNDRHHIAFLEPFLIGIRNQLAQAMSEGSTPAKTA